MPCPKRHHAKISQVRRFGRKEFHYSTTVHSKKAAEFHKKDLQDKAGQEIRTVKVKPGVYRLYTRARRR